MAFVGNSLPLGGNTRYVRHVCSHPRMNAEPEKGSSTSAADAEKGPQRKSTATWSDEHLEGFSVKGAGSVLNWDLRPSMMRGEDVAGVCDLCRGTGKTPCSFCQGVDYLGPLGNNEACNACNGKHIVQCSACYGSGKQVDIVDNWFERGIAAMLRAAKGGRK